MIVGRGKWGVGSGEWIVEREFNGVRTATDVAVFFALLLGRGEGRWVRRTLSI
jgi:hypothetical protein